MVTVMRSRSRAPEATIARPCRKDHPFVPCGTCDVTFLLEDLATIMSRARTENSLRVVAGGQASAGDDQLRRARAGVVGGGRAARPGPASYARRGGGLRQDAPGPAEHAAPHPQARHRHGGRGRDTHHGPEASRRRRGLGRRDQDPRACRRLDAQTLNNAPVGDAQKTRKKGRGLGPRPFFLPVYSVCATKPSACCRSARSGSGDSCGPSRSS
jgi:hypothetical protein